MGLERDREQYGYPLYDDEDCAVRALAYHRGIQASNDGYLGLAERTRRLKAMWQTDGLLISDIPRFEKTFKINLDIFSKV